MKRSHKKTLLTSSIVFIVLAVVISIGANKWSKSDTETPLSPVTLEEQSFAKSIVKPKAGVQNPKKDYAKIIERYEDKIIQFDEECRAFPSKAVFRAGTDIMLDNRGSSDREVSIGSHHTIIPAYDFMIYTLSSEGEMYVSCGPLKNTALIISQ